MSVRRCVAAVASAAVLLVAGCGSGSSDDDNDDAASASEESTTTLAIDPDKVSKLVTSRLQVEVDGEVAFDYDDTVDLRVVSINTSTSPIRFFSAGIHEHEVLPDDATFRVYVDLAGDYEGDGDYEIPKVGGDVVPTTLDKDNPDPNAASRNLSKAYLSYIKLKPGETVANPKTVEFLHEFQNALEPCSLEIADNDRSGELDCPELADVTGKKVHMKMTWSEA